MIILRSEWEIELIRESNRIVACVFNELERLVEPGVTTLELDRFAERMLEDAGARPAFKGYRGYPATLCTSINEQVVHGIPNSRKLKEGDIISIDMGAIYQGYYGDAAKTFPVGAISKEARRLIEVTEESLYKGIEMARPGNRLHHICHAIQSWVESHGYGVVRDFVGHGIGRNLHEDPQVPNYVPEESPNPRLEPGMVLALEPMVNIGTHRVKILSDGWTAVTEDNSLSAHFEHSILITDEEPEILSRCS